MGFIIESTVKGRGLTTEECIAAGATLAAGELIALTAGAGLETATLCGETAVPHGIVVKGGIVGATCTFVRILPGDILKAKATAADGTTAMSAAEVTACIALVGSQALQSSATGLTFDGVTASGSGKLELVSFDSSNNDARVRIPIVS
ncbi:MAG: hypothetical protein M0R80_13785 [Proteobacteria bacterium]|jgi:hypothetical protein|nr:hypothetical protein [Pseudomonadota bacterium]